MQRLSSSDTMSSLLKTAYYNVPIENETYLTHNKKLLHSVVYEQSKTPLEHSAVNVFLEAQDPYTLHRKVTRNFKRNHYYANNIDHIWECDLCDMSMFAKTNDNYKYLLTVIDVLSKYAWVEPVKDKSAFSTTKALMNILKRSEGRQPQMLRSDRGKEFKNNIFRSFLHGKNIKQQFPQTTSLFKCAVVEAFNKTIKNKMFRYFTLRGNNYRRYIDVLQDLVRSYNNTVHSTIAMRPIAVKPADVPKIYAYTHRRHRNDRQLLDTTKPKFNVNDHVRVIKKKTAFDGGYQEKWGREVFLVTKIINKAPYRLFELIDLKNHAIDGKFYAQELQRVAKPPKPKIHPFFIQTNQQNQPSAEASA